MPSMNVKEVVLRNVSFQANQAFLDEEPKPLTYRLKVDSQMPLERTILSVSLGVETPKLEENPDCPFFFDLTMVGVFEFCESITDELRRQYATINGPAIIFPFLRETLADLIRRAGFPPLLLPVTNFIKLAQSQEQRGDASISETAGPPKKVARKPSSRKRVSSPEFKN